MAESRYQIDPDNAAIFSDFLGEAPQLLESIEAALLDLASNPLSKESVDAVMRSLHTLKGIFGFLALESMASLCHAAEGALEPFQGNSDEVPQPTLQRLLRALDALRAQVAEIGQGLGAGNFKLIEFSGFDGAEEAQAPEASPDRANDAQDRFLRIKVEKMDALLELVGEMAIAQAQVAEGLKDVELPQAPASELARLGKISRELQENVLSLRLVPIEPLFVRASRVAHDVALKTGKAVDFVSEGKDTELDKRMAEELAEPLLHLIRNAVDHGLEDAQGRALAGKPAQGRIELRASHQAGGFLLELEDDGKGLDLAKLAARGKALGLLLPGEEQDEARITSLIFEPGFSTADTVTDISGRGVGLDAVRSRIHGLKGDLRVESRQGKGCVFSIRLPLTMALVDGILLRVGVERYIVPAGQVKRFVAMDDCAGHGFGGGNWLESRGLSLPLIDLGKQFGKPGASEGRQVAVHVGSLGREAALIVDEVLGKQQVVAKGLGANLESLDGIAGGAILGDGKVSLILDLEALLGRGRALAGSENTPQKEKHHV